MHVRFARVLSQLRHEKGVSQRQAAQALGVPLFHLLAGELNQALAQEEDP